MAIWTEDDIDALRTALRTGIKSVSYNGPPARTVVYQDLGAMRSLLASMIADVAAEDGTPGYRLATWKSGFYE